MRPVGSKYSANYYNVAILNWAKMFGYDVGRGEGYASISLFATPYNGAVKFVIEARGPDWPRLHISRAFSPRTPADKRKAWREISTIYRTGNLCHLGGGAS